MRLVFMMLFFIGLALTASAQTTWYVPDDFPTIKQAIADPSVVHHDTIIVRPGTYVENFDFFGKAITLKSERGPEETFIDGNQSGSVIIFQSLEGPDTVLDGFTITNGSGTYIQPGSYYCGGGILCRMASPTIRNNIITENSTYAGGGGGIGCLEDSAPCIQNNIIRDNETTGYYDSFGGGILCSDSRPDITNNIIIDNYAFFEGGGVACRFNAKPLILDNLIEDNRTSGDGGGIYCSGSNPTIAQNSIIHNSAYYNGGGIACTWYASPLIKANLIVGNEADDNGGGIACYTTNASPTITNNLILRNHSMDNGGGIYCEGASLALIVNNTLVANTADEGGGIYSDKQSNPEVVNTIIRDNQASIGPEICAGSKWVASSLAIIYSNVKGGSSGTHTYPTSTIFWGDGNIDADPLFKDPAQDDYHLSWLSPCINRGINHYAVVKDMDGDPRPYMGTVDMGADEFVGKHSLEADLFTVHISGGTVDITLDAGSINAGRWYLILGSLSGSSPGMPLPGAGKTLPMNFDPLTLIVMAQLNSPIFSGFLLPLDANGQGAAQLNTPFLFPDLVGKIMTFAFCLQGTPDWDFVSNPIEVTCVL